MNTSLFDLQQRVNKIYSDETVVLHTHAAESKREWDLLFQTTVTNVAATDIAILSAVIETIEATYQLKLVEGTLNVMDLDARATVDSFLSTFLSRMPLMIASIREPLKCKDGYVDVLGILSGLRFGFLASIVIGRVVPLDCAYLFYVITYRWSEIILAIDSGAYVFRAKDDLELTLKRGVEAANALCLALENLAPYKNNTVSFLTDQ